MIITLRMLGRPSLTTQDGTPVAIATRKAEALLFYLASHPNDWIPRETLCALLWPRSADDQARASLRQELAVLRKPFRANGIEIIAVQGNRLSLAPGTVHTDLEVFRAGIEAPSLTVRTKAIEAYGGDFLSGFTVRSDDFIAWSDQVAQVCHDKALQAAKQALEIAETSELGAPEIEKRARRILEISTVEEQAHIALMRLFHRTQQKGRAFSQYQLYKAELLRLLEVEPSEAAQALMDQILRSDSNDQGLDPEISALGTQRERRRLHVVSICLNQSSDVGRDPEEYDGAIQSVRQLAILGLPFTQVAILLKCLKL